jgi:hypothetical protein
MNEKQLVLEDVVVKTAAAAPTVAEYSGLQAAYERINAELFGNELPNVMIVLTRKPHSNGHFGADRFETREGHAKRHEVSLNPDRFFGRTDKEILRTLAHEAVHVLQEVRGVAPKRAYHNKNFAAEMKERGLYPSNTGAPGGKETGAQMSHYIIPGGAFEHSYERLRDTGWKLNVQSTIVPGPTRRKRDDKTTFTCSLCDVNAWGRKSLFPVCGSCLVENYPDLADVAELYRMVAREPAEPESPAPAPEKAEEEETA